MYELHHSDCLAFMRTLPDNHVDAIVTDPPYELGFMGKGWDKSGIANSVEMWKEALRILKPGGHLLAFSGSRTYHRMTCAIEDAGFQVRDQIQYLYGSGFPKSLDVGKAIDRMDASEEQERRRLRFTAWVRSTGVTSRQIDEATGTNMGGHYTTAASQPAIMTREHLEACRHLFGNVPDWVEREADIRSVESKNFAEREVVGQRTVNGEEGTAGGYQNGIASLRGADVATRREIDLTAPATPAAKQWDGWGTALKPAHEPICVARKPLIGTVAQNVLTWGTGAINVAGCRVEGGKRSPGFREPGSKRELGGTWNADNCEFDGTRKNCDETQGRWPANVIHDGSDEVKEGFPETKNGGENKGMPFHHERHITSMLCGMIDRRDGTRYAGDSGSAARFFKECQPDEDAPTGRWPANVIHDGSDEVKEGFPDRHGGGNKDGLGRRNKNCFEANSDFLGTMNNIGASNYPDSGSAARFFKECQPDEDAPAGRWPANVIHDGSDEVVEGFPETTSGGGNGNRRGHGPAYGDNTYGNYNPKKTLDGIAPDSGSAARYFYCSKASKRDRDEGLDGMRCSHPTVKPTELMRYLCRLVTPPGGLVFDPFTGSGSTGKAAILEGFRFLGCDMTEEYIDIARARIEYAIKNKPNKLDL